MENVELQSNIVALLHQARQAELAWMSTLSTAEHWSAKDLLAHIAAWKRRNAENLARTKRGETRPWLNTIKDWSSGSLLLSTWASQASVFSRAATQHLRKLLN
jgi:hypothetical protein